MQVALVRGEGAEMSASSAAFSPDPLWSPGHLAGINTTEDENFGDTSQNSIIFALQSITYDPISGGCYCSTEHLPSIVLYLVPTFSFLPTESHRLI